MAGLFPPQLRVLLQGSPFGEVYPPKPNPLSPSIDGRTAALHILREYFTNLVFFRPMAVGQPPQPFSIPPEHFYIEWPDQTEMMKMPCVAVVNSRAKYDVIGLVSYIEEDTRDTFGAGTVLQWMAEYLETLNVEVWTSKTSERRSILAGAEIAFSPTEQMSGVRFRMPEYFNELVCFTLNRREVIDEPDAVRNRRRAQLEIEMRFNIVALVNYTTMQPTLVINTDVDGSGADITGSVIEQPSSQLAGDLAALAAQNIESNGPINDLFVPHTSSFTFKQSQLPRDTGVPSTSVKKNRTPEEWHASNAPFKVCRIKEDK